MKSLLLFLTAGYVAITNCQTIKLGPRSNYEQPPAATATASGDHLEIFPEDFSNGIPKDGIDVAFGPDLQMSISKTLDGVCAKGFSQACSNELSKVLNTDQTYTVASRIVGIDDLLLVAGVAALGVLIQALILEHRKSDGSGEKPVSVVNIPATDLAQIQSQDSHTFSSIVVIATDTSTVTITPTPSASISAATITTLTADDKHNHKSGDIIISLPTPAAQMLSELIYKSDISNKCVKIQLHKRQFSGGDLTPVNDVADFVLPFLPPQQLLRALALEVGARLRRLVDVAQEASLAAAQAFAGGLPEFAGVGEAFRDVIVEVAWLGVLMWCGEKINDLSEIVIRKGDYHPGSDDDGGKCPVQEKEAPTCKDSKCKGSKGNKCTTGEYKDCKCLTVVTPHWTGGDKKWWSALRFELQGLLSDKGWSCDQQSRITLETDDFNGLASAFCKGVDLTKTVSKDVSPKHAGFSGYEDYNFRFTWTKKSDEICMASCTDIYQAFTSNNICSYDSHTKVTNGFQDFTCGTASFNITKGNPDNGGVGSSDGTVHVDKGDLKCGTEKDQGNANHFTTLETMEKAAEWFCETQTEKGLKWQPGQVKKGDDLVEYHYNSYEGDQCT